MFLRNLGRTHPVWKKFTDNSFLHASLSSIFRPEDTQSPTVVCEDGTEISIGLDVSPKVKELEGTIEKLKHPTSSKEELQQKAELSKKKHQEPDWVLLNKYLSKDVDIEFLRDGVLQRVEASVPVSAAERQELKKLNKWVVNLLDKLTTDERQRLQTHYEAQIAEAADPTQKEALKGTLKSELGALEGSVRQKFMHWLNIAQINYANIPYNAELPPLPPPSTLKVWYGVHYLQIDPEEEDKLKRWQELFRKERDRLACHPDSRFHLRRTLDWESSHAADEAARQDIKQAYEIEAKLLDMAERAPPSPEHEETRRTDAVALQFIKDKTGQLPGTHKELYASLAQLGPEHKKEFEARLYEEKVTANFNQLLDWRKKHPDSAINQMLSCMEDTLETLDDEIEALVATKDGFNEELNAEVRRLDAEWEAFENQTVGELLDKHPDWVDELSEIIQKSRWDLDVPKHEWERAEIAVKEMGDMKLVKARKEAKHH